jgi:hypothetical protein
MHHGCSKAAASSVRDPARQSEFYAVCLLYTPLRAVCFHLHRDLFTILSYVSATSRADSVHGGEPRAPSVRDSSRPSPAALNLHCIRMPLANGGRPGGDR